MNTLAIALKSRIQGYDGEVPVIKTEAELSKFNRDNYMREFSKKINADMVLFQTITEGLEVAYDPNGFNRKGNLVFSLNTDQGEFQFAGDFIVTRQDGQLTKEEIHLLALSLPMIFDLIGEVR